tara:strand:- start:101 stop:292 length:192 start_codon:yes stop_codon:yes gene_type:complete
MPELYQTIKDGLELDESIALLKELSNKVSLTDVLTTSNMDAIASILAIIKQMKIPIRMTEEKN